LQREGVFLNMLPINQTEVMIGNAATRFDKDGNLTDDTTKGLIRQLLANLVAWARRLQQPPPT
jgi:chromate reductase